jgi:hypothetical protein
MSDDGLFLGLDYLDKTVLLFDREGEIVSKFNRSGADPWAFGYFLFAIGFHDASTISILSEKGIFFYALNGDLKNSIGSSGNFSRYQTNSQLQLLAFKNGNVPYIITLTDLGTELRISNPEFYNHAYYFTLINLTTGERVRKIQIPENDIYRNRKFFYPDRIIPIFDISESTRELRVKFPIGDKLYIYSLSGELPLINTVDLELEHFREPTGIPFDRPEDFTGFSVNGYFRSIFSVGDTTFLFYRNQFDIEKFSFETGLNFSANPAEYYSTYGHLYTSDYCQILVHGKKISNDIIAPKEASYIGWVTSKDYIIAGKEIKNLDYEPDHLTFLIFKIVSRD